MAKKKKEKIEGVIKNSEKEHPVDVIIKDKDSKETDWNAKTVEAESKTKLEDDKGTGEAITIRTFEFAANPEAFKDVLPSPQQLFNAHLKQIEIELWKDGWTPYSEVAPRIMFSKDKTHYRIMIAAKISKGSNLSYKDTPLTLSEIAHSNGKSTANSK